MRSRKAACCATITDLLHGACTATFFSYLFNEYIMIRIPYLTQGEKGLLKVVRAPDIAKPLTGLGSGVMELALKHRGDAFRVV